MSRESEVAQFLAADGGLAALVPGGIYAANSLPVAGITDAITTPDVWVDGEFQPTIVVRQGLLVPTGLLTDFKSQETDSNQRIAVWMYALDLETLEAIENAVYALMQGHAFTSAWPAEWIEKIEIYPVPELPPASWGAHLDFRIRAILRPILA